MATEWIQDNMKSIFFAIALMIGIKANAETFVVALPMLPKFNPITNQLNVANYIGLHLYYPMFKMNKVGDLDSEFFDLKETKAKNKNFISFKFCLKKGLTFSDKSKITSLDFELSLKQFSKMYSHMLPLKHIRKIDDRCAQVEMTTSTPNLFKRLTGMSSTIIKAGDINRMFPTGFGPYTIKSFKSDVLTLEYNLNLKTRFNEIEFKLIKNTKKLAGHLFHDINQLPPSQHSSYDIGDMVKIEAPTLKVYSIVINLPSLKERKAAQCLLRQIDWIKVYELNLISQNSFLPINKEVVDFKSHGITACKKNSIKANLLVPDIFDSKKVLKALKSHNIHTSFNVVNVESRKLAEWAFSGKPYIALMGFDSSGSISSLEGDFSVYFESFFTKRNRIISKPILKLQYNIQRIFQPKTSIEERLKIFRESDLYLIENAYIIPLGRLKRSFTFPKNIEIDSWADYFSGFPEINRIK